MLYQRIRGPTPPARRLAGGCRRARRHRVDAAGAGAGAQGRPLPRDGQDVGPRRQHRRLAPHGRPRSHLPARYGPRAERPRRPGTIEPPLRRRAGSATAPRMDSRRRRRACAPRPRLRPGRVARQRRTRRLHVGRAHTRARDARHAVRRSRPPGAREQRLHHPHARARGARHLLARAARAVYGAVVARDGGYARAAAPPRPPPRPGPRPVPYARRRDAALGWGERRGTPPRRRVPPHLGAPLARSPCRARADRVRHERRPRRHLDREPARDVPRRAAWSQLAATARRASALEQGAGGGRRGPVEGAQRAQVHVDAPHPRAGAAPLGGPVEGGPALGRCGDAARL